MPTASMTPTADEQLLLELTNRLRLDPGGAADHLAGPNVSASIKNAMSYFGVDAAAFHAQMQSYSAVAPLAWNTALTKAATVHTQLMIDFNQQSHQLPGEDGLRARFAAQGYTNGSQLSENVFAWGLDPLYAHAGFVIDWGYDATDFVNGSLISNWRTNGDGMQDPAGHRAALLNASFQEVGIALLAHVPADPQKDVGPQLVTQDFGSRWDYKPQLLGVVINDADADAFYDIGEGLGGVSVTATGSRGSYTTTSWSSGGYQMELPTGSYTVTFTGGGLTGVAAYSVTIAVQNVKLDAFAADAVIPPPAPVGVTLTGISMAADVLTGTAGDDLLFGDGLSARYFMGDAQQVYRLYQATLGRAPDMAGLNGWTALLAFDDRTPLQVATGFVTSAEFQATYGALDNSGFVTQLYQNVLNRGADAGGLAGWTAQLQGGASRAQVVLGFSDSAEFVGATRAAATEFATARDVASWTDDVFRLYQATLDRAPDVAGLAGWANSLATGTPFLTAVAGFVNSAEFKNSYGSLGNSAFVERLYNNVLDRAADAGGLAGWTAQLQGGVTRAQVVQGFSQSAEFIATTGASLKAWVQAQVGGDVLNGGAGANDLWGGAMSDQFVFTQATDGTHRIHDFEVWDVLTFEGFGYTNATQARAHMVQTGADVIFTDQGVTVHILETLLATIESDSLLFT